MDDNFIHTVFFFVSRYLGTRAGTAVAVCLLVVMALIGLIIVLSIPLFILTWVYMRWRSIPLDTPDDSARVLLPGRLRWWCFRLYQYSAGIIGVVALLLLWVLADWLLRLSAQFVLWSAGRWWFIPIAVFMAWSLFLLRKNLRCIYASLEIAVGVASISTSVLQTKVTDLAHLVTVSGGIYILIRGLDNFDQGMLQLKELFPRIHFYAAIYWDYFFIEVPARLGFESAHSTANRSR